MDTAVRKIIIIYSIRLIEPNLAVSISRTHPPSNGRMGIKLYTVNTQLHNANAGNHFPKKTGRNPPIGPLSVAIIFFFSESGAQDIWAPPSPKVKLYTFPPHSLTAAQWHNSWKHTALTHPKSQGNGIKKSRIERYR